MSEFPSLDSDVFRAPPERESPERESRSSPVDVHVGSRIRLRRTLMGMSQERLGDALGLTFQQVQKYERGANRVSASRLFDLSRVLDVPISFFFDDMDAPNGSKPRPPGGFADAQDAFGHATPGADEALHRRESLELIRAYYRIADPAVRRRVFELVKSMGPPES